MDAARARSRGPRLHLALAITALVMAGCGGGDSDAGPSADRPETTAAEPETTAAAPAPAAALKRARCPADLAGCRAASGRIIYVEKIDPDGDGDAHFVLESAEAVTGPGITVVDVSAALRPDPLPGVGDRLSAAGRVVPGSYGQRQIEAVEIRFARRG